MGHTCRECRQPILKVGEPITERRGARISSRYHAACFSGFADPRSQLRSSFHEGHLSGTQLEAAPDSVEEIQIMFFHQKIIQTRLLKKFF